MPTTAAPPVSAAPNAGFGALTPLLAPRSVAVVGASERDGNLGGLAVGFLAKFGYRGAVWPVNPGVKSVRGQRAFAALRELPSTPDLAIIAVPADGALDVARECAALRVPAAIVWAGGFADAGDEGRARQQALAGICREGGVRLCGPNCIGVINTSIGLTASFSSMLAASDALTPGFVSMVSQSGGIAVMAHARAERMGLGFRITVSAGNEAVVTIPDFMRALVDDDGTRVLAVYVEGLSAPDAFVDALEAARARRKPVVVMKGGASEASGQAALAHTGRLAGHDRVFDAILREFAAIRVHSTEELLDVSLELASRADHPLPAGERVLVSSFGGGSGVVAIDQLAREGLATCALEADTRARIAQLLTPFSSTANPVDFTPGMVTDPRHRARMPEALASLATIADVDAWLFLAAGFAGHAPEVAAMFDAVRRSAARPVLLAWQAMPAEAATWLAARGVYAFDDSARAARTLAHLARHRAQLARPIGRAAQSVPAVAWTAHVGADARGVIGEDRVAALLRAAGLPVARGRRAISADDACRAATQIGYPVAIKGLSGAVTHRAAAGLVALGVEADHAVIATWQAFATRAVALGVALDGVYVQAMQPGAHELIVTAFRDEQFGVVVGCGVGGALAEIADDMAFVRAPVDAATALALLGGLRTLRKRPSFLGEAARDHAARFVAGFSTLAATAPYERFTLEVNPLKLGDHDAAAVDGLLVVG